MSDKKIELTKEIVYEHVCSKCNYNNRTTYNWPIKVYEQTDYKFKTYCTECGKEYTHQYVEVPKIEEKQEDTEDGTTIKAD